jgi:GH25 family lysozyme M1 (1,4-beta-N-acetylmuramidase)
MLRCVRLMQLVTGEQEMALLDIVIDVSDAQEEIDWNKVAAGGIKVAMIKATEGATVVEKTWSTNKAEAEAANITVIPYHFMTNAPPADQAANFNKIAKLVPGHAYALDWEPEKTKQHVDITASADQVEAVGRALLALVGRTPLGYWGIPGSTPQTPTDFMQTWERWVPRYREGEISDFTKMPTRFTTPFGPPGQPSVPGNFRFWQYTDGGIVPGIVKPNDRSVGSFDTAAAMIAWCTTSPATVA